MPYPPNPPGYSVSLNPPSNEILASWYNEELKIWRYSMWGDDLEIYLSAIEALNLALFLTEHLEEITATVNKETGQ